MQTTVSQERSVEETITLPPHLPFLSPGVQSDLAQQLVEEKWEMLLELMQEKATFVFGKQGCLTDTELRSVLKVRRATEQFAYTITVKT